MEEATASMAYKGRSCHTRRSRSQSTVASESRFRNAGGGGKDEQSKSKSRISRATNRIVRQPDLTRTELTQHERCSRGCQARIEHLAEVALRRMRSRTLAQGWTNWLAPYRLGNQRKRILQFASRSLLKPRQSFAFNHWRWDWKATLARQARDARAEALLIERAEVASANAMRAAEKDRLVAENEIRLQAELQQAQQALADAQAEFAARAARHHEELSLAAQLAKESENERLAQSLEAMAASEAERQKLVADAEAERVRYEAQAQEIERRLSSDLAAEKERASAELAAEKEKHVEHAQQMAIRRLMRRGLALGFSAWSSSYHAKQRQQRVLEMALLRECKKELSNAWAAWLISAEKIRHMRRAVHAALLRACKQDLTRAWMSWHARWRAKRYRERIMKVVFSRLFRSRLTGIAHWRVEWRVASATQIAERKSEARLQEQAATAALVIEKTKQAAGEKEARLSMELRKAQTDLSSTRAQMDDDAESAASLWLANEII